MELNRIYHTDALSGLRMLPDGSVDCIVTSPPYWQMRDYGIAPLWWAADERCSHQPDESGYCARCGDGKDSWGRNRCARNSSRIWFPCSGNAAGF